MIIITTRADELAQWIEDNCAEPSSYRTTHPWSADMIADDRDAPPVEIELKLSEVDQTLFDLRWPGYFVQNPNGRWYDDTPLIRMMIGIRAQQVAVQQYLDTISSSVAENRPST